MNGGRSSTQTRFIADAMLGKLARWMRTLGADVEFFPEIEDSALVDKAVAEGRVILTRDTLLVKRREARSRSFFVEGDHVGAQLRQVADRFGLPRTPVLDRCLRCNRPLEREAKAVVAEKVPPYVLKTQEGFSACPSCGRVYWAGTHRRRMEQDVERMLEEGAD
ncbi:MAG: Mut7-C RNAse domain-containing protein [Thermodesulfobacteriota bacterium]